MIPDRSEFLAALAYAESLEHKDGWEQSPACCWVIIHEGEFLMAPVAVMLHEQFPKYANLLLDKFARMLIEGLGDDVFASRPQEVGDTGAGIMFMSEAWSGEEAPPPGLGMADVVSSVETRFVLAIDTAGVCYWVQRIRGQEPTSEVLEPGSKDQVMGGIVCSLARILFAAMRFCQPEQVDLDALKVLIRRTRLG